MGIFPHVRCVYQQQKLHRDEQNMDDEKLDNVKDAQSSSVYGLVHLLWKKKMIATAEEETVRG